MSNSRNNPETSRYIVFSGGGWNSHTASAGWVNAALEGLRRNNSHLPADQIGVNNLFKNIDGVAGNSGGSWFLSMLGYSEKFEKALTLNADDWFKSSGYMGQLKSEFDSLWKTSSGNDQIIRETAIIITDQIMNTIVGEDLNPDEKDAWWGIIATYAEDFLYEMSDRVDLMKLLPLITEENKPSWIKATKDLCYKPFNMDKELSHPLTEGKNKWAEKKDIQITIAMPTKETYFSGQGASKNINAGRRIITGEINKNDINLVPQRSETYPGFISASRTKSEVVFPAKEFKIDYKNDSDDLATSKAIGWKIPSKLSVIDSTAISSSAAGILASTNFLKKIAQENLKIDANIIELVDINEWVGQLLSRYFGELAIPVELSTNGAKIFQPDKRDNINSLRDKSVSRLIDGGYVDNTAVTSALYAIQDKKEDNDENDFSITVLSNSTGGLTSVKTLNSGVVTITSDVANLFGNESSEKTIQKGGGTDFVNASINTVSPHIFDIKAWDYINDKWSYQSENNQSHTIDYYKVDVETIDNEAFGIKKGLKGELNIFINATLNSNAAPFDKEIFNIYENLFEETSMELQKKDIHDRILDSVGLLGTVEGSGKSEHLAGTIFSEKIRGGAGDDILLSNGGHDVLTGGRGSDTFKIKAKSFDNLDLPATKILIRDLNFEQGDRIKISDAENFNLIDKPKFSLPQEAAFKGRFLLLNTDSDPTPDLKIKILGEKIDHDLWANEIFDL